MGLLDRFISIDKFGSLFSLFIQGEDEKYKSFIGAFATVIFYTSGTGYLCYLLVLWSLGMMLPKIISQTYYMDEGHEFTQTQTPFYFSIEAYGDEAFNELKSKKFFSFQTDLYYNKKYHKNFGEEFEPKCDQYDQMNNFWDIQPLCLNLNDPNQKIIYQNQKPKNDSYFGYYIFPCKKSKKILEYINLGDICIPEEEASHYFIDNLGKMILNTQQLDIQTNKLIDIQSQRYFTLNKMFITGINLNLKITSVNIFRGTFFPEKQTIEFVSDIEVYTDYVPREEGNAYAQIWVSLQRVKVQSDVEHPRLPEIFAQAETIFRGLLSIGIIFCLINHKLMKNKLIKEIGAMYFTNFDILIHSKSEIKKSQISKEQIQADKKLKNSLRKQFYRKINILNILHEISKIQIALQMIFTKDQLAEIQHLKYTIQKQSDLADSNEKNNIALEQNFLEQEDFFIFSRLTQKNVLELIYHFLKVNEVE